MKMLLLWVPAVLSCFLAQYAQGALQAHPQVIANLSPELLQHVIMGHMDSQAWIGRLQNLPLQNTLKSNKGGLLGGIPIVGQVLNSVLGNILGVNIRNAQLLSLDISLSERDNHIIVTIPADLEIELRLPLNLGRILHLKLFLDVQVGVRLYQDPNSGLVRLVIGNCLNNPGHLRITLFDNSRPLSQILNNLLRTVTDVLEKTLPHILQRELCPIANGIIRGVLNVLQGSFSSGAHGEKIFLTATSFSLQNGVVQLGYHGSLQMSGGMKYEMTPSSTPLPHVDLHGSSMNLLLSDHFLCSVTLAQLNPQIINVASPREVSIFSQQMAMVPGYALPKGTIIRTLQIAYRAPALSLKVGRIQIVQQIEIKVFGDYPRSDYQLIFAVQARVVAVAGVSIAGGNLKFHLGLERVENVTLSQSSVGSIYARQLVLAISQLVSTSLLSHENDLLNEGIPLPLVQDLGLTQLDVAVGQGALLVFAPRQLMPAGRPAVGAIP